MASILERVLARGAARAAILMAAACGAAASGCASHDVGSWQAASARARPPELRTDRDVELARVEELRRGLDLEGSRQLALFLAAEHPDDPSALHLASRAESDEVFLLPEDQKDQRSLAALSALDYAERAAKACSPERAEVGAQLAWALGTTTHLQPMFSRSAHARRTLELLERTLKQDPENATALATLSILRLRLATLPWMARAMAWGAPEGSIEEAVSAATRCVALEPSVQHRIILAKALLAAEKRDEARAVLEKATDSADRFPRDRELRREARGLLSSLKQG
jgi:tetratricopeptide (TPR) repeat protein